MTAAAKKGVLNYSTTVAVERTIAEMQKMLAAAGAARIAVDYADGDPAALSFMLATAHGPRHFTLPVNIDAMHAVLQRQENAGLLRTGTKAGRSSREQAARVAWRVVKDWLAAQLALVETTMVDVDQVMLPYLHVDDTGRTLFESYKATEFKALGGRDG